ncbi:MAG: hypothetical protein IPP15_02500 [Saprospiraceae bacterium]|uniref:DUF6798 domain-containing protein n=1 Tax=Candidatus Opimibacter skivensis TaxID=2982028 RepID=A0A9D7ST54_9BACT|nr:hypothetical protein [Candidatus Opimibacter skivensis]
MTLTKQDLLSNLLAAVILYGTVLVYQGYQYGQGDQTQILPCLWAQDHPGTYGQDHYVQHYLSSGTNERTIFHFLLRHLGYDQPWLVWIWHALSTIALILAWISIATVFIKNKVLQWLCIGMILTLGFHTSTGSNELYYNLFIPSLPAKALASWAFYFWLREKYFGWSLLLILAGYLQPLVGLQIFLLTVIVLFADKTLKRNWKSLPWRFILIYIVASIPWYYFLAKNNGSHTDPVGFMNIMEFRLSHHFFASYFGTINLLLGALFAMICILFYSGKTKWIFITIVIGCFGYEIGVEVLRMPIVLYSQWWKTTIWMEAFAFVAVFAQIERIEFLNNLSRRMKLGLPLLLLTLVCVYRLSGLFDTKPDYMFPWSSNNSDDVEICEMAKQMTPDNAVFIVPLDLTAFRWYSKRSLYVDYKAMIHNETFLKDWYQRIGSVYDYDLESKKTGVDFSLQAAEILSSPSDEMISKWKNSGITHLISSASSIDGLELIGQNHSFSLFKLP